MNSQSKKRKSFLLLGVLSLLFGCQSNIGNMESISTGASNLTTSSREPSSSLSTEDGGYVPPADSSYYIPDEDTPDANMASPTPDQRQTIYLWGEEKMPARREYSESDGYYDPPSFRPYMESYPAQGTIKGAVFISPGGAFQFRSMTVEGYNVAERLSALGYQCFVVSYRVRPYTQQEGALDLTRALRYVRYHASEYGIEEDNIALVGFSAGGILSGELLLHNDGHQLPSELDPTYVNDALDYVSAEARAIGHIYSFYGRLSVSNNDVETLREGNLPPTFYAYGTRDPFYSQFQANAEAVRQAGVTVEEHVFENQPHGFGAGTTDSNWIPLFDSFLTSIFAS